MCLLSIVLPLDSSAAEKRWAEVRSAHFRVLSDGNEKDARAVARQFEQMRMAFAAAMPWLRLDSPVPLLILAPRDEDSAKALLPETWKRKGVKPGGFFASGGEKAFAVVRLDVVRRQSDSRADGNGYQVVYHEYTHYLLNANFRWLPLWLNEGLAEFFGNTQFKDNKIYLGAPNIRAQYTQGRPLVPLEKLMNITLASPEYRDEDRVQIFYSESWGLVHLLLVPSEMERGKRLREFLNLLEKGVDQKQAFREAIGDLKEVEERLNRYLGGSPVDVLAFNNSSEIPEQALSVRQLSLAETNAELGTAEIWMRENGAARRRLDQALKGDPRSGLAAESMGFLKFEDGKDTEALAHFERALELDGKRYLAAYYRAMLLPAARRAALNHVLELNPEFPAAYVQLATGYIREGNLESAIPLAVKAQQLWPSRAGYHLLIGNILHAIGRDTEAAAVARYIAERWQERDHDEAVELWERLPDKVRQDTDFRKRPTLQGTKMLSGKVTSVACHEEDQTMKVVIDGAALTLHVKGEVNIGFPDTLWYGADHFSRCRHLEGMRAVIQYGPSTAPGVSGELAQLDIYEDFFPGVR